MSSVKVYIRINENYWGTSRFNLGRDLTLPVHKICFVTHENEDNVGTENMPPTNHWSLFLDTSSNGTLSSVGADMAPEEPLAPGMIILEKNTFDIPDKQAHVVACDVLESGVTVETILKVIIDKGRDRYGFSIHSEGCRYWLSTFALDLVSCGLISEESAKDAHSALRNYWRYPVGAGSEERAMDEGVFF